MGSDTRHFQALLKKNIIYWGRRPSVAICQMLIPGLLMIVICYLRAIITPKNVASVQLYDFKRPFYPIIFNETDGIPNFSQTTDDQKEFMDYIGYPSEKIPFDSLIDPFSPLLNFDPHNCRLNDSFMDPKVAAPIIAIVGTPGSSQVQTLVNSTLQNYQKFWQKESVNDLYLQNFDSQTELFNYISSKSYLQPDPGVCFGFEITMNSGSNYDVKLYFNDQVLFGGETAAGTTPTNVPVTSISDSTPQYKAFNETTEDGYAFITSIIANAILQVSTGNQDASISTVITPWPTEPQVVDAFNPIMKTLFPTFLVLMFSLPVYNMVFLLVKEKESKTRETMKIMGLNETPYWLSWFAYYTIVNTVISIIAWCLLIINVVTTSGRSQLFFYIWMYGESLFGEIVFLQSFFSRSKFAGLVSALFYIGISLANVPIQSNNAPMSVKLTMSLIPQVANFQIAGVFAKFQESSLGMNKLTSHTEYDNYVFNSGLGMFVAGLFFFLIIGIYLDAVLPHEFGTRRHPCYFLFPSTYAGCCKKRTTQEEDDAEKIRRSQEPGFQVPGNEMEMSNINPIHYEPVGPEVAHQAESGDCVIIDGLEKTYDNGFQAVKGLNIKIYQNQIFALLGQNGAGKTTTISILTGLFRSSKGEATAFNFNMFTEPERIRNFMGICPQYDVLFEFLTPIEHLNFFYELKGGNPELKEKEIAELIKDVGLTIDKDKPAGTLSGGNKRKLSVAIALCGGSKLVLLDEPTAGMDLGARRALWDMLKNYRRDKIIILTTHYMDEADILGDRIGIMAKGKMMCLGTSLFLKQKFGTGYKLTMVKATKSKNKLLAPFLTQYLGPVELLSEVSSEIQFQVSQEAALNFKTFFEIFDQELENLKVVSYGVSITTLEDVFLKINKEFNIELKKAQKENKDLAESFKDGIAVRDSQDIDNILRRPENYGLNESLVESQADSLLLDTEDGDNELPISTEEPKRLVGHSTTCTTIGALLIKRFDIYKRDRVGFCCEIVVPFIMVLIGSILTKIVFVDLSTPMTVTPVDFKLQRMLVNSDSINQTGTFNIPPSTLVTNLPDSSSYFLASYEQPSSALAFYNATFDERLVGATLPYRYGSYLSYYADASTQTYQFVTYVNLTSSYSAQFWPAFMYESVLKTATLDQSFNLQMTMTPFPSLYFLDQRRTSGNALEYAQMVALGLALIPCAMVSFILKEREEGVKHMQIISGMKLPAYWFSNFVSDLLKVYIPICIIQILAVCFGVNYPGVIVLFMILPFALVPFTYTTSFLFKDDTSAQITTIFVNVLIAGVMAATVYFLQTIPETFWLGDLLRWVFTIIPNFCVINGLIWSSSGQVVLKVRALNPQYPQLDTNLWGWTNMGGDAAILCMHFVFDTLLLILIEADVFKCLRSLTFRILPPQDHTLTQTLDEDVIEEEDRVNESCNDVIKVVGLRKAYTSLLGKPFLAVERISFGLDYGECFALLGVNGAGKSTTFKTLTADEVPTNGFITVAGYNIQTQFKEARQLIGYCPQKDAIFPLMSVEEHLWFYAKIKGIPEEMRKEIVENAIEELNLSDHRKKASGTLSGGNKRKLSVAIATLGNPPIILLDEPSAGMDPEARRFMWQVVSNISQRDKKSAVILTTHSMEEAEALSTKMGIMVRGGIFKCLGSSQHIKNKYGTGFEVEIKVRKPNHSVLEQISEDLGLGADISERIDLDRAKFLSKKGGVDDFILDQLSESGIGSALFQEAEQGVSTVRIKNFVTYIYVLQMGLKVVYLLAQLFPKVELIEQFSDFFKFRIPKEDRTIGWLFGLIEESKKEFNVSEYSVSQTSLEQIFQAFAKQSINDRLNLTFQLDSNDKLLLKDKQRRNSHIEITR